MMTEMDIETLVYYDHLTRLIARENFIKFTRRESTKTYITQTLQNSTSNTVVNRKVSCN
jgi:hypothetical protein